MNRKICSLAAATAVALLATVALAGTALAAAAPAAAAPVSSAPREPVEGWSYLWYEPATVFGQMPKGASIAGAPSLAKCQTAKSSLASKSTSAAQLAVAKYCTGRGAVFPMGVWTLTSDPDLALQIADGRFYVSDFRRPCIADRSSGELKVYGCTQVPTPAERVFGGPVYQEWRSDLNFDIEAYTPDEARMLYLHEGGAARWPVGVYGMYSQRDADDVVGMARKFCQDFDRVGIVDAFRIYSGGVGDIDPEVFVGYGAAKYLCPQHFPAWVSQLGDTWKMSDFPGGSFPGYDWELGVWR